MLCSVVEWWEPHNHIGQIKVVCFKKKNCFAFSPSPLLKHYYFDQSKKKKKKSIASIIILKQTACFSLFLTYCLQNIFFFFFWQCFTLHILFPYSLALLRMFKLFVLRYLDMPGKSLLHFKIVVSHSLRIQTFFIIFVQFKVSLHSFLSLIIDKLPHYIKLN